jgi:hypothetical protein
VTTRPKKAAKKTTPARKREQTVDLPNPDIAVTPDDPATPYYDARDEEGQFAREDQTVAPQAPPVESDPAPAPAPLPEAGGKGMCDNHPDRPAALVTNFRWTPPQRFCGPCIPANYRHLL